jgi:Phage Terminase
MAVDDATNPKGTRGGARPGAGRKPKPKRDRSAELEALIGPSPRKQPGVVAAGEHFARFCRLCRVTQGAHAGQPLELEDWERRFVDEALAVDSNGHRIFHKCVLVVPRKSGKTTLAGALGVYLCSPADAEQRPVVIAAAGSREQAAESFDHAHHFLLRADDVISDLFQVGAHQIKCPPNGGLIRTVSGVGALNLGTNPHVVIADELATWATAAQRSNSQALTTGQGGREDPLVLALTTAGDEAGGVLGDLLERVKEARRRKLRSRAGASRSTATARTASSFISTPSPPARRLTTARRTRSQTPRAGALGSASSAIYATHSSMPPPNGGSSGTSG